MPVDVTLAADVLRDRTRILVFTGAGISTESGIPDFRGPDGVWTKVDPSEFTYDKFVRSAETRRRSWEMRFASGVLDAEPNEAHRAVARWWRSGTVVGCVTQNIDGLHQRAGMEPDAVVELHGNAHRAHCLSCRSSWPVVEIRDRWESGEADPHCEHCGGIIKASVISFGELMPQREMLRAMTWAEGADAVVAIGSTLSVYPAAAVPIEVARRGMPLVIVNLGPTDHDDIAMVKIEGPAGEAVPALVDTLT